jgi:5-methylcytosine-specific restriction endonuclease McrA
MTRALTLCQEPGCPRPATQRGRCRTHQLPRRASTRQWRKARRAAIRRAHGRCERCGQPATTGHHRVHAQHGGPDTATNLIMLCDVCHRLEHGWGGTPQ